MGLVSQAVHDGGRHVIGFLNSSLRSARCSLSSSHSATANRFEPAVQPPRDITKIMERLFHGTWATYGEVKKYDKDLAELWYNEFQDVYERRIFERNSRQTEGDGVSNDHRSDNFIFLDVVGVDKKGRIYGLGAEAGKYKPSSSRSSDGISLSEYEHMRTAISKISVENMELKERG